MGSQFGWSLRGKRGRRGWGISEQIDEYAIARVGGRGKRRGGGGQFTVAVIKSTPWLIRFIGFSRAKCPLGT